MSQRILIGSSASEKGSWTVKVTGADTGQLVTDLSSITIRIDSNDVVTADISYIEGEAQRRYVESVERIDVVISGEAVDKQ